MTQRCEDGCDRSLKDCLTAFNANLFKYSEEDGRDTIAEYGCDDINEAIQWAKNHPEKKRKSAKAVYALAVYQGCSFERKVFEMDL